MHGWEKSGIKHRSSHFDVMHMDIFNCKGKLPSVEYHKQQALLHCHGSNSEEVHTPASEQMANEKCKTSSFLHQFCQWHIAFPIRVYEKINQEWDLKQYSKRSDFTTVIMILGQFILDNQLIGWQIRNHMNISQQ